MYSIAQRTLLGALWWPKWEGNPPNRGYIYIYIYMADSLCCTAETDTAVQSNCTLLKKKKKLNRRMGFPGGSADKESTCNEGDQGSIPGLGRSPGKGNATHSSILAWRIPWTVQPMGSQRVGHDWGSFTSLHFRLKCGYINIYIKYKYTDTLIKRMRLSGWIKHLCFIRKNVLNVKKQVENKKVKKVILCKHKTHTPKKLYRFGA